MPKTIEVDCPFCGDKLTITINEDSSVEISSHHKENQVEIAEILSDLNIEFG